MASAVVIYHPYDTLGSNPPNLFKTKESHIYAKNLSTELELPNTYFIHCWCILKDFVVVQIQG